MLSVCNGCIESVIVSLYRAGEGKPIKRCRLKSREKIDDITCPRRYEYYLRVEHEKIQFISTSGRVIFCLLYKHTIKDDFTKISDHFPKIYEEFSKLFRRLEQHFRTLSEDFWRYKKLAEDFRGGTDDVSIIQQHSWVLFKRLCSNSNGNLKTCENNMLSSRVKIYILLDVLLCRILTSP